MPALSSHQNDELNNSPNSPGLSRCQCTSSTCRQNPPTTCIYPRHMCSLLVSRQVPHFTPPRSSSHPVSILSSLCLNPFSPPPLHHASVLSPLRLRSFTPPRYFLPSASAGEPGYLAYLADYQCFVANHAVHLRKARSGQCAPEMLLRPVRLRHPSAGEPGYFA